MDSSKAESDSASHSDPDPQPEDLASNTSAGDESVWSDSESDKQENDTKDDAPAFGFGTSNATFSQLKKTSATPFWQSDESSKLETAAIDQENQCSEESKLAPVNVHTGEEEENTLFSSRSKLYFTSKDKPEWCEKGAGIAKINEDSTGSRRISTFRYLH